MFHENVMVLMLSKKETDAWKLVAKCKYILAYLPPWMRRKLAGQGGQGSKSSMKFEGNDSEIEALPSTDDAGRSTDATLVVRDELEYHPFAEANYAAVRPTGAQLIDLTTQDKSIADSHFQQRFMDAYKGVTNTKWVFLGAMERPVRENNMTPEQWWENVIVPSYSEWQRENEYPLTLEEALRPSIAHGFFDNDALNHMERDIDIPIKTNEINTFNGMVKIFRKPVVGRKYCLFTDPSDGFEDPHHTVVIDSQTQEEMACSSGMVKADRCAEIHDSLVRYYNNAFNAYELNSYAGGKFDETLKNLETPNRCPFINTDGKLKLDKNGNAYKYGWWTTRVLRRKMINGLEEGVRLGMIRTHSADTIEEFRNFIVPAGGEPCARKNWHDDKVMAWGGVLELNKYKPVEQRMYSFYPRTN